MKTIYNNIKGVIAFAVMTLAFAACSSDDEATKTPIATPTVSAVASQTAPNRLAFQWSGSDDVYEYAYKLKDADGAFLQGDITNGKEVSFNLLQPGTTYQFGVTAYPRQTVGSSTAASEEKVIEVTTTPVVLTTKVNGPDVDINWTAFEGIDSVRYTVTNTSDASETYTGTALPNGSATITVSNISNYEAAITCLYSGTDSVNIADVDSYFSVEKLYKVLWTKTGIVYLQGLDKTCEATIEAYSDGRYCIKKWYDGTTDFIFTLTNAGNVTPENAQSSFKTTYYCNSGRTEDEDDVYQVVVYQTKSYAYNENGQATSNLTSNGGKISLSVDINNYDGDEVDKTGDGKYTFTW